MRTKQDLINRVNTLEKENDLLYLGFQDSMAKAIVKVGFWSNHKGMRYTWHVSRLDNAAGGLWYETYYCCGQRPQSWIRYLNDIKTSHRSSIEPYYEAYNRALQKALALQTKAFSGD